ncbi:uncharacterized protein VTP21DRAFT_7959 [Calcarisporiella thermophila]|uniref:uncharacterized protein n=1 Tax=Calcarisporiella thermophila TaxID=911321 RepID=UPI003742A41F
MSRRAPSLVHERIIGYDLETGPLSSCSAEFKLERKTRPHTPTNQQARNDLNMLELSSSVLLLNHAYEPSLAFAV